MRNISNTAMNYELLKNYPTVQSQGRLMERWYKAVQLKRQGVEVNFTEREKEAVWTILTNHSQGMYCKQFKHYPSFPPTTIQIQRLRFPRLYNNSGYSEYIDRVLNMAETLANPKHPLPHNFVNYRLTFPYIQEKQWLLDRGYNLTINQVRLHALVKQTRKQKPCASLQELARVSFASHKEYSTQSKIDLVRYSLRLMLLTNTWELYEETDNGEEIQGDS